MLISQTDLPTNGTTLYTYDKAGRKIKVTNTKQKVEYQFGKSYNSNTGLNNYGFRDYSSSIGRFITSDPIRDGTNWYTLAVNNPINFVDLWGLCTANEKPKNVWENYTGAGNPYENYGISTTFPKIQQNVKNKTTQYTSNYRCDMYAWNSAIEDGKNPLGQNGEDWNIDIESVNDIFSYYPNLRFSSPQNNTCGFAFYFESEEKNKAIHVEYYTNVDDDPTTYNQYKTDGLKEVEIVKRSVNNILNLNIYYVPIYSKYNY